MKSYETENLVVRTFTPEDWKGIQELAVDKLQSPAAPYDHAWPTSEEGCRSMANGFSTNDAFWAVCTKRDGEIVGIIVFNGVDAAGVLDFGHLFHSRRASIEIAKEAIARMVQYVFDEMKVERVITHNAAVWEEQIRPLELLGFRKVEEEMATFESDASGKPIRFLALTHEMTREDWYERQTGTPAGKVRAR